MIWQCFWRGALGFVMSLSLGLFLPGAGTFLNSLALSIIIPAAIAWWAARVAKSPREGAVRGGLSQLLAYGFSAAFIVLVDALTAEPLVPVLVVVLSLTAITTGVGALAGYFTGKTNMKRLSASEVGQSTSTSYQ